MTLDDYRGITIRCDTANEWMPTIRANTGDVNGRMIRVALTDGGKNVTDDIKARLYFDPSPEDPGTFGDLVDMTPVEGEMTATFEAPIPAYKPGRTRMSVAFSTGDWETSVICTRSFDVMVEANVLKTDSPTASGNIEKLVRRAETAAEASEDSADSAAESERLAAQHLADIGTSKEDAAASAEAAKTSELAAADSAGKAAGSADTASAAADSASASATSAAASASKASDSAALAEGSADEARRSETSAADSASASASGAEAAKASELAAADSAAQASADAGKASESSRSASESAQSASTSSADAAAAAERAAAEASEAHASQENAAAYAEAAKQSGQAAAEAAADALEAAESFDVQAGDVDKLPPGSQPTFTVRRDGGKWIVDVGLVTGDRGENTAAIGDVSAAYVPGGETPSVGVEAGGTPQDRTLLFTFSGLEGTDGHTPVLTPGVVTTLPYGSQPTFGLTQSPDEPWRYTVDLGIPAGRDGSDGSDATVREGDGVTVAGGVVSVKARPNGGLYVGPDGVGVMVDGTTIGIDEQGRLVGAEHGSGAFSWTTIELEASDFDDDLTAIVPVEDAEGAMLIVGPEARDLDNMLRWYEAAPFVQSHTDAEDIPDGSLRMTLANDLDGPLGVMVYMFKPKET